MLDFLRRWFTETRYGRFGFRQSIEAVAIIGGVSFAFWLVALVLVSLASEHEGWQRTSATAERDANFVGDEKLHIGAFEYMLGGGGSGPADGQEGRVHIVDFAASAAIRGTSKDVFAAEDKLREHQHRVRGIVGEVTRSMTKAELVDPSLSRFRARLRTKLNGVLGGNVIQDIFFSSFRSFESPTSP